MTVLCMCIGNAAIKARCAQQHLQALHVGSGPGVCSHCLLLFLRGICGLLGIWQWCGQQYHALSRAPPLACGSCQSAGGDTCLWKLPGMQCIVCLDGFHWQRSCTDAHRASLQHKCLGQVGLLWYALCNIVLHALYPTKEVPSTAEVMLACASDADKWQM